MSRTIIKSFTVGILIAGLVTPQAAATQAPDLEGEVSTAIIGVGGMTEGPDGLAPMRVIVVSGPEEQLGALVDARVQQVGNSMMRQNERSMAGGDLVSPLKSHQVDGICGWSWVELRSTGNYTQGQGYLRAGWKLKSTYVKSAGAYTSNVIVYSNSHLDGWVDNFENSGTTGGMEWEKDTRVTVSKTQDYGAHMNVGSVAIVRQSDNKASTCHTRGPRVDGVELRGS